MRIKLPLLLVVAMLSVVPAATAQNSVEIIADRIGPLGPRAASYAALAAIQSVVGLYYGSFRYADQLDDASWIIVQKQLGNLARLMADNAVRSARDSDRTLRVTLVAALAKLDQKMLAELAGFLQSAHGEAWLAANIHHEEKLPEAFLFATAHTALSRQRGTALLAQAGTPNPGSRPGEILSVVPINTLIVSQANELALYGMLSGAPLLDIADAQLTGFARDSAQAVTAGLKNGLYGPSFQGLTRALGHTLRTPKLTIALIIAGTEGPLKLEEPVKSRFQDLVARSYAAMDGAQTNYCRFPIQEGVIRDIGTDVGRIMNGNTPIKPGSVEHSWVAQSLERGCHGKKDFALALRVWEDMVAGGGSVRLYCKLADYYRLGIGTRLDSDRARLWGEKFQAAAGNRVCEPEIKFNLGKPWDGLPD